MDNLAIHLKIPEEKLMSNIRKANADDALIIAEINVDTWKKAYAGLLPSELLANRNVDEKRINSWKENIANPDHIVLVYEDKKVCGYLWGGKKRDKIDIPYEIYAIYVSPECQNSGIGRALIAEYKKMINNKPFYLYILKGNASASAFYQKMGGKENMHYNRKLSVGEYSIEEEIYIFK